MKYTSLMTSFIFSFAKSQKVYVIIYQTLSNFDHAIHVKMQKYAHLNEKQVF